MQTTAVSRTVYLVEQGPGSGKSAMALGLAELLSRKVPRIGVFRPVVDSPDELRTLWRETVARSRALVAQALENGTMDQLAARALSDGRTPSLRWIVCHLIEEYARHNGHADLLRESIDGQVGE